MSAQTSVEPRLATRVPAPLLALIAIASVQCGSAVARGIFDPLGAAGVTLLRLGLAAGVLLAVLRPPLRTWSRSTWRAAAALGVVMAGMNLAFYLAIRTLPLGVAVTVEFVGPLLLAVSQARHRLDLVWAAAAASGVVLLGVSRGNVALPGLALALLAGGCWAGYIVASAHVGRTLPGADGLAVAFAVAAVLVLPFGAAGASVVTRRPALLLPALVVALLSSVVSYGLELAVLRRMPTRVFGILMSLEPAAAAVAGLLFLGQRLQPHQVLALVLVSAASAGVTLTQRAEPIGALPAQPLE